MMFIYGVIVGITSNMLILLFAWLVLRNEPDHVHAEAWRKMFPYAGTRRRQERFERLYRKD